MSEINNSEKLVSAVSVSFKKDKYFKAVNDILKEIQKEKGSPVVSSDWCDYLILAHKVHTTKSLNNIYELYVQAEKMIKDATNNDISDNVCKEILDEILLNVISVDTQLLQNTLYSVIRDLQMAKINNLSSVFANNTNSNEKSTKSINLDISKYSNDLENKTITKNSSLTSKVEVEDEDFNKNINNDTENNDKVKDKNDDEDLKKDIDSNDLPPEDKNEGEDIESLSEIEDLSEEDLAELQAEMDILGE